MFFLRAVRNLNFKLIRFDKNSSFQILVPLLGHTAILPVPSLWPQMGVV